MHNFTSPKNVQSTRTTPASTDAGMTLSDLFADPTTPTGGALQPLTQGPLIIDEFVTAAIPWIFVNYLMPLKATNQTTWESTDGDITVFLSATPYKDAHGVTQQHLPSGRIAREVLVYLVTSAMASGSPEIEISRTWRGFLRDMGIRYSHPNRLAVQKQLRAILNMTISISHQGTMPDGTNLTSRAYLVGSGEDLFFDRDGALDDAYRSVVVLSHEFFERIAAAPSPVHGVMHVLMSSWRKIVNENPHQALAGDVFWWLAGRMSRVRRETRIPWSSFMGHFGSTASHPPKFRSQFRAALAVAAREYFSPLGEDFDWSIYVTEYGAGTRGGNSGILLSPISAEHRKLMAWSRRQGAKTAPAAPPTNDAQKPEPQAPVAAEIVSIPAHEGFDLSELRVSLAAAGLPTNAVSDGALRAAVDKVLSRVSSFTDPHALVVTSILKNPALIGGTAQQPVRASHAFSALPVEVCTVHGQEISGLVCGGCAAELKAVGTDAADAAECWEAVKTRLTKLSKLEGVDTSGAWMRYSSLAARHGI